MSKARGPSTTRGERRDMGTRICTNLTHAVAHLTPPGIGAWPTAWELTADASTDFLVALAEWEESGEPLAQLRVSATYDALVEVWLQATREYAASHPSP